MKVRPKSGLPDLNSKFIPKMLKTSQMAGQEAKIEIFVHDVNALILRVPSTFYCA